MKILTETTSLCGISLLKCFCVVLLLVQLCEGMENPVPPSNLPSNGKECMSVTVSFIYYNIDRCSTVSSL